MHEPPGTQPEQLPPQSVPVSSPFWTPSEQLAEAHVPEALQAPLTQSLPVAQLRPTAQTLQPPPQSMSVSLPL
jgi:hypothetical protein